MADDSDAGDTDLQRGHGSSFSHDELVAPYDERRSFGRVVRDPVHDYVVMHLELNELIDHPFVQRLRRISQTAMSSTVYPSMNGKRFEHSLGAMHLASRAWFYAWNNSRSGTRADFTTSVKKDLDKIGDKLDLASLAIASTSDSDEFFHGIDLAISAAALLHDLGHPPYSHTLEDFYVQHLDLITAEFTSEHANIVRNRIRTAVASGIAMHEAVGEILAGRIERKVVRAIPWSIVDLILRDHTTHTWSGCLHNVVAGEVDVDRLDYLLRDAKNSGTEFGAIDKERLLQSLKIAYDREKAGFRIAYQERAVSALESFLVNRHQYYRWVVFHYHTIAANRMLNLAANILATARPQSLRQLNYFVDDVDLSNTTEDALYGQNALLSLADDATLLCWLKDGILHWNEESDSRRRFHALISAVIHRTPNWAPSWKSELEYRSTAADIHADLFQLIVRFDSELTAYVRRNGTSALSRIARKVVTDLQKAAKEVDVADLPTRLLDEVCRQCLSGRENQQTKFEREVDLAAWMTRNSRSPSSLFSKAGLTGFWVIAYNEILPAKTDDPSAVRVVVDDSLFTFHELAGNSVARLSNVENSRVKLHCFFVSSDGKELRTGSNSNYPNLIREEFSRIFVDALEMELWRRVNS
ncbi:hypothetical protein [Antrihabitans spumae]|uniref:HD/PDEase domain-containing protein n=1 Tax=Antrihabitans spumae TaxID=3373370 RepID=A0ABW7JY38_9NOCA